jgi:hypothetical protein
MRHALLEVEPGGFIEALRIITQVLTADYKSESGKGDGWEIAEFDLRCAFRS